MSTNGLNPSDNRAAIEGRLSYLEDHEKAIRSQLERNLSEQYELYCELANHERRQCKFTPVTD